VGGGVTGGEQAAMECVCALSVEPFLQNHLLQSGVLWHLMLRLFNYDFTLEESTVEVGCTIPPTMAGTGAPNCPCPPPYPSQYCRATACFLSTWFPRPFRSLVELAFGRTRGAEREPQCDRAWRARCPARAAQRA
jgi:hypothetical protein